MHAEAEAALLRILVVDDHEIVREGLRRILTAGGDRWETVATGSGSEALASLRQRPFDVAIVDLAMAGMGGLELIGLIRAEHPQVAVLVLSMHAQVEHALRAFRAGARGYVTQDGAGAELIHAVRKLAGGGAHVTPSLAEAVVLHLHGDTRVPHRGRLSEREMQVLRRLVAGESLSGIGAALQLSVKTVSSHKARILDKLQLPNLAALVRYGVLQGLADVPPCRLRSRKPAGGGPG